MQEAWDELNAYLSEDERYRSKTTGQKAEERDRADRKTHQEMESLRQDYANLEVSFGAPFEEVKRSYKKLLRRYHPDRHSSDPEKLKLATEITTKINESYNRIKIFKQSHRRPLP